jgi:peptide/nickel transport system substrate-binding protein
LALGPLKLPTLRPASFALSGVLATVAIATALALGAAASAAPQAGIAMHDEPKYGATFPHLNYVNPDAPKGGGLRLAVLGGFDSLNPYIVKGAPPDSIRDYVYEPLLARSLDEPFSLYGLIAETVETPEDRGWVSFQLRSEARFSDGTPITQEDVLFSWSLLKSKGRPNHRFYYAKVVSAEKIGERGVKFTFEGGDREMPLIMGLMPVLPRHAIDPETFDKTSLAKPLGSGPYVVEAVDPGASILFRRNPDYWGRDIPIMRGHANFDTIRVDYYRDQASMEEAFRKGLIHEQGDNDAIDAVKWAEAYDFPAVRDGLVKKLEFDVAAPPPMSALVFNTRRPMFADPRVREALTLLFDFEWVNRTFFRGLYARTESFFDRSELSSHGRPADARERELLAPFASELAPGVLDGAFTQPATDGSGTNREGRKRAIALLEEAGYALERGVMTNKATGQPFAFEMLCPTRDQQRLMLAYARFVSQIGVKAQVRFIDSAQYQRRMTSFDFDMVQSSWASSLSPGNEQNFRWSRESASSEGSFNYAGVQSAGADAMIAAMLAAKTRADFVSAVRAFDRILLSGRYGIPLYHAPKQWIAAWSFLRQPPRSTLYGTRVQTWWAEPSKSVQSGGVKEGSEQR